MRYSQPFNTAFSINPAFAGTRSKSNFYLSFRDQWPQLTGSYTMTTVSAEHRFDVSSNAIGFELTSENMGEAGLSKTQLSGIYSHIIEINKKLNVAAGLMLKLGQVGINKNNLVFEDQINDDYSISDNTNDAVQLRNQFYIDISSGLLLYSDNYWIGLSAANLNTSRNDAFYHKPIFNVNTGVNYIVKESKRQELGSHQSIQPIMSIDIQSLFSKALVGIQYNYTPIVIGVHLVNIPILNSTNRMMAAAIILGYYHNFFKFGYSYDVSLNKSITFGGAHEISLGVFLDYENNSQKNSLKRKKTRKISCPKF